MKVEVINCISELVKLKDEWKKLEESDIENTFFQTYSYNYLWWDTVKNNKNYDLSILVVREEDDRILAIAPFYIERVKRLFFNVRVLKFMAWGDYLNILINIENTNPSKIFTQIFEKIKTLNIDKVNLSNININSKLGMYIKRNAKLNSYMEFQVESPYITLSSFKNFEDYKKLYNNKSLNNLCNRLQKQHGYEIINESNKKNNIFNKISSMHIELQSYLNNSCGISERRSLFLRKDRSDFIKKVFLNDERVINFYLKDREENILGYWTGYKFNKKILIWNIAHDIKFENYSIGRILAKEVIFKIFTDSTLNEYIFDFGCGGYPWKFQWTDEFNSIYKLEYETANNFKMTLYKRLQVCKLIVQKLIELFHMKNSDGK